MIARVWKGETQAGDFEAYSQYLERTGRREALATQGNRGVLILRRIKAERAEFVFVSLWDSLESVKAFAGPDVDRARYYEEDPRYLLSLAEHVDHFEVVD